eukprot:TRINITY_DN1081_c0_g1_i1.p1 TRINITY_DN1081_c0_g1~~TRINITY_DN1081_c0_g1_i1.p1  ORF type:complete len:121 (-),score=39.76 TRINITY_DN1081_c0_g1_i1:92-454(-)
MQLSGGGGILNGTHDGGAFNFDLSFHGVDLRPVAAVVAALFGTVALCLLAFVIRQWLHVRRARRYLNAHELDLDDIAMLQMGEEDWGEDPDGELLSDRRSSRNLSDENLFMEASETGLRL